MKKIILFLVLLIFVISGGIYFGLNKNTSTPAKQNQSSKVTKNSKQPVQNNTTQTNSTNSQNNSVQATSTNSNVDTPTQSTQPQSSSNDNPQTQNTSSNNQSQNKDGHGTDPFRGPGPQLVGPRGGASPEAVANEEYWLQKDGMASSQADAANQIQQVDATYSQN
ncbi:hypothetical protein ACQW5G_05260 [Fructilactobacillus sp. Tb1]|uniref:hypothetical protein n=1 Tax=Fructilactobacillus sp. Tb1 TaxID=3422304 RepID=UPI003D28ED8C